MSSNFVLSFSSFFILSFITNCAPTSTKYAIVMDAGSSGTRVWIYWWTTNYRVLPEYKIKDQAKNKPGLSSFAGDEQTIKSKIGELIDKAKSVVPAAEHSKTSIYLFATAGMRFLSEDKAKTAMQHVDGILNNKGSNPFHYESPHNARILSGEEEGVFAWLAVNYLTGALQNDTQSQTSGILELGGASTQITFESKGNILANKFPVKIGSRKISLYSHSYLNFGQDAVDKWLRIYLANNSNSDPIADPCSLSGHNETIPPNSLMDTGDPVDASLNRQLNFVGSGNPNECVKIMNNLVDKVGPRSCYPKPCAVGTVYQPIINGQTFYAMSAFTFIFRGLKILDDSNFMTPLALFNKSFGYCQKSFDEMKANIAEAKWKFLSKPCSMGIFVGLLLTKGYGFRNESRQIIGTDVIKTIQADWTLGALIYEDDAGAKSLCPQPSSGSSLRPPAIFMLPVHLHSFLPFLQTTFSQTGNQPAVAILIYLVLVSIFKRLQPV